MDWFLVLITTCVLLLVHYLWKRSTMGYDLFEKQGIPHLKPIPFFGTHLPLMTKKIGACDFIKNTARKFPAARIIGLFDCLTPLYMINDPELIKQIAVKDFEFFINRQFKIDREVDTMFGNILFNLDGQKWKDMRVALSPVFTGSKMRRMFDYIPDVGKQFGAYFKKCSANDRIVEMRDTFKRFGLDAIASTNYGIKVNSLEEKNNPMFEQAIQLLDFSSMWLHLRMVAHMSFPWLARAFKIKVIPSKRVQFFRELQHETEQFREKTGTVRNDAIHLLMQVKKGQLKREDGAADDIGFATVQEADLGQTTRKNFTDEEITAQAFLFFFAGFEPLSVVGCLIAYELALNPDIQEKLRAEIDGVENELQGANLTYECLQRMKYMDMVISEALRVYSPADFADRTCGRDYKLKNDNGDEITIPKGAYVWLAITALHSSEKYFENPDKFDPERFSDENKHKIVNGSYIPFGIGPRNCIGSRFALMELKAATYYLLKDFVVEKCAKTQVPLKFVGTIINSKITESGIWLNLVPRMNNN